MRRTFAFRFVVYCAVVLIANPRIALAARVLGVDVSTYQGTITWSSVHSAGKDFAFARASTGSSGATYVDPTFTTNMQNGTAAGLLMGAYHYAYPQSNSPSTEAAHFLAAAGSYIGPGYLRPVVDIEEAGGTTPVGASNLSAWTNAFIDYVVSHSASGAAAEPLIYCNTNYAQSYLNSTVASRDLWIANWNWSDSYAQNTANNPGIGVFNSWSFWQYSDTGSVSGISGNVDKDVAAGDINFVRTFLIGPGNPEQFDVNGTAAGSGITNNGSYTWESAGYSSTAAGTDPVPWTEGNFLRLAAGTDAAASNYTITANSNHTVAGMMLQSSGGGTVTINGPGVLSIASGDQGFYVSTSTQNLKINAVLAGSGRLVWQGAGGTGGGSLYLLGSNTFSGGVLLNTSSGLNFNNDHSFGTGLITWGVAQQVLAAPTATAPINIGNAMLTRSASTLVMASFAMPVTFSGGWTLATGISTLDVRSGVDTTISGNISGTDGTSALTKISPGKLTLSGANTYTGGTTITAGTLQLGNGGTTGKLSTTGAIANNASLIFNRTNTVTQGTDFSGSAISGTGSLTQFGNGTLTLSAANTYTGKTFINSGTISISADSNLGAVPASTVADQLTFVGSGATLQATAGLTINSKRGITFIKDGTIKVTSGSLAVASTITNTGGSTATITGGGDFNPSANNSSTFTNGKWYITGGSRWLNANNDNNSGAAASPVADFFTFDNGTYVNNSGHTLNANKGIKLAAGGGTIDTTNGDMTFNGVISGPGSLTKLSANTLTLGGANTYAGTTTISGGTLIVSAASATFGSGNVTVQGATAGTSLVIQSGVGNAINDSAMLSLAGGGTVDVADQGYANLGTAISEIVGSLVLGGVAQAEGLTYGSTSSGAVVQSDEYFAGTGTVSVGLPGDFNGDGSVDAGDYVGWRISQSTFGGSAGYDLWRSNFGTTSSGSGSSASLSQAAVPEPGAMILGLVGISAMTLLRGRRRKAL